MFNKYTRGQEIMITVLSVLTVITLVVCSVWGKNSDGFHVQINDANHTIDSVAPTDSFQVRVQYYNRYSHKGKECFRFELNSITKEELMKFPGIAGGRASAIVGYRERLGGYYSMEQLLEIKCMNDTIVEKMKMWGWVSCDSIEKIDVENASVGRMKFHPYINFYQAKSIDSARWVCRKRGWNFGVDSCRRVFTAEEWKKVCSYLK